MDYVFTFLVGFFVGLMLALMPDFVVMVKGGKGKLMLVEYKDKLYRLVPFSADQE